MGKERLEEAHNSQKDNLFFIFVAMLVNVIAINYTRAIFRIEEIREIAYLHCIS